MVAADPPESASSESQRRTNQETYYAPFLFVRSEGEYDAAHGGARGVTEDADDRGGHHYYKALAVSSFPQLSTLNCVVRANDLFHPRYVDGLGDMAVHSGLEAGVDILLKHVGGHGDNGYRAGGGQAA